MNADKSKASSEWMRVNVLGSFSDDYEDLEMVLNLVRDFARDENLYVEEWEIITTLLALIKDGHAKAYSFERPSQNQPAVIDFQPGTPKSNETVYFYVTDTGKKIVTEARHK
jgi:hypothetical protein